MGKNQGSYEGNVTGKNNAERWTCPDCEKESICEVCGYRRTTLMVKKKNPRMRAIWKTLAVLLVLLGVGMNSTGCNRNSLIEEPTGSQGGVIPSGEYMESINPTSDENHQIVEEYDSQGKLVASYEYDELGNLVIERFYEDGELLMQRESDSNGNITGIFYYGPGEQLSSSWEYKYYETGTSAVERRYEAGELSMQIEYTLNGSRIESFYDPGEKLRCTYRYDESGNLDMERHYDESGVCKVEVFCDEDGKTKMEYCAHGLERLYEYDLSGELQFWYEIGYDNTGIENSWRCYDNHNNLAGEFAYNDGMRAGFTWYTQDYELRTQIEQAMW